MLVGVPDLAFINRNRLARKSARKTAINVPYTVSMLELVVVVVRVKVFVTYAG